MTRQHQHPGYVTGGALVVLRDQPAWKRAVARLKGRAVLLTINSAKSQERYTQDQMGYYRGVVLPLLAEEWGWADHAELHFRLKEKLLPPIIPINQWPWRKLGRDEIKEPPSMADMNVEQTSAYLQAVIDLAVEMGVEVPEPRRSGKP